MKVLSISWYGFCLVSIPIRESQFLGYLRQGPSLSLMGGPHPWQGVWRYDCFLCTFTWCTVLLGHSMSSSTYSWISTGSYLVLGYLALVFPEEIYSQEAWNRIVLTLTWPSIYQMGIFLAPAPSSSHTPCRLFS